MPIAPWAKFRTPVVRKIRTMPSAASEKTAPRLKPMIVYAAKAAMRYATSAADPTRAGVPATATVSRVREAVVRIVGPRPVRQRHRPTRVEILSGVEGLDQRLGCEVRTGPSRGVNEEHRRRPGVLGVDVERLELAGIEVLHGAQVLPHRRVSLVIVRREEGHQRMSVPELAAI